MARIKDSEIKKVSTTREAFLAALKKVCRPVVPSPKSQKHRLIINSTMDRQNGHHHKKSAVLYDAGGWFLVGMFFGVVFIGVVLDYLWNYLVLSVTLSWRHINILREKKARYCVIITAFGLLIDWLYYEFTWGTLVLDSLIVPAIFPNPGTQPGLEFITILIPMALIGVVNYSASRLYLHTDVKSSLVVGVTMAVFTAPWLILAFVLLNW